MNQADLRARVPVELRQAGRYAVGVALDATDRLHGRPPTDSPLPPRRLRFVGQGDFVAVGAEVVEQLRQHGGLQPDDDVLDVGCGIGRVAIPLAGYLTDVGSYRGFDVVPAGIDWCQRHISPRYPNFRFDLADLANTRYRRRSGHDAAEFRFPYEDRSFDFAFATSVFTHLVERTVRQYLAEIGRVLRPGAVAFTTWYLLDPETRSRLRARHGTLSFRFDHGSYAFDDARVPEAAVAYDEQLIAAFHDRAGLAIETVDRSNWSGSGGRHGQDIICAVKRTRIGADRPPRRPAQEPTRWQGTITEKSW